MNGPQNLYNPKRTPRDVVLKGRQVGITTLEQARDLWFFLTRPGARVVVTCQSITDHGPFKNLAANFRLYLESLRRAGYKIAFRSESAGEWVLPDERSLRIVEAGASEAAAQKKGRSGTVTRLHISETAFYEYAAETLNALLECVPGIEFGTEIVSESTPNGASGVFFEQCKAAREGATGYAFHFLPTYLLEEYRKPLEPGEVIEPRTEREHYLANLGVAPEMIKWYRHKVAEKGQDRANQEYPIDPDTCFLVDGRLFFDRSLTQRMLTEAEARPPLEETHHGILRIFAQPRGDARYTIAVDTSEGVGGDFGVAVVLERGTGRHMATLRGQFRPWDLAREAARLGRRYNTATIVVERNNHGHACLRALDAEEHYPRIWKDLDGRPGWNNTEVSRVAALDALYDAHLSEQFWTPDPVLIHEMLVFVVGPTGKAEAAKGEHDDLVLAMAIGWDVISKPSQGRTEEGAGFE